METIKERAVKIIKHTSETTVEIIRPRDYEIVFEENDIVIKMPLDELFYSLMKRIKNLEENK